MRDTGEPKANTLRSNRIGSKYSNRLDFTSSKRDIKSKKSSEFIKTTDEAGNHFPVEEQLVLPSINTGRKFPFDVISFANINEAYGGSTSSSSKAQLEKENGCNTYRQSNNGNTGQIRPTFK